MSLQATDYQAHDAALQQRVMEGWKIPFSAAGPLTEEECQQFWSQGWVIKHGIVPQPEIDQAIASVEKLVDDLAQMLFKAGKITDLCEGATFHNRLIKLEEQFPHANVLLHKRGVLPQGIIDVWSHDNLLDAAEQVWAPRPRPLSLPLSLCLP
jgi:hypothetical protein